MKKLKISLIFIIVFIIALSTKIHAENLPSEFDLREHIEITVRDQGLTNTCWAFSITSLISNHSAYIDREYLEFSTRHMDYSAAENAFVGEENEYAYPGNMLNSGGHTDMFTYYFGQGIGPILERNMPFSWNTQPMSREDYSSELAFKQVTEVDGLLPIRQEVGTNGEILSYNVQKELMTNEEITNYHNDIKSAIMNYGGVDVGIWAEYFDSSLTSWFSNVYFGTEIPKDNWHSVVLIGWDDNYSKNNFSEERRPKENGAYIALNSWGEDAGENGFVYISYEESSINTVPKMYIKGLDDMDYDYSYKNDLTIPIRKNEVLTEITIVRDAYLYGYIYIDIMLNGNVIMQNVYIDGAVENIVLPYPINLNSNTLINVDLGLDDEYKEYFNVYYHTRSTESQFEVGEFSNNVLDEDNNEIYFYTLANYIDNGKKVDVKILNSDIDYTSDFFITGNTIRNNQTGIFIKANGAGIGEYEVQISYNGQTHIETIEVDYVTEKRTMLGDVSNDGKITVTDLSQLKMYIVGLIELGEENLQGADMNSDGKITTVDLSRLKMLIVGLI